MEEVVGVEIEVTNRSSGLLVLLISTEHPSSVATRLPSYQFVCKYIYMCVCVRACVCEHMCVIWVLEKGEWNKDHLVY